MWQLPPTMLRAFRAVPAEAPDILLDTLTEGPNRFFSLACPCDSAQFSVTGEVERHLLIHQDVVVGAVTVQCRACMREISLFDPARHGYDVELDHFPPPPRPSVAPRHFECPACHRTDFALVARFEYSAALVAALERGLDSGYANHPGREQDLFTWFTLIGFCSGCAAVSTVSSVECA